jgi:uncharacterized repeat protein (TIGR01451 family)
MALRASCFGISVLAATLLGSALYAQVDVVTNGSFEDGINGWTAAPSVNNDPNTTCGFNVTTASGTESITGSAALPPSAGTYLAMGSIQDATTSGGHDSSCTLYQDVAIPAGATTAQLSMKWGLKYIGLYHGDAALLAGLFSSTSQVPYFTTSSVGGISFYEPASSDSGLVAASSSSFSVASVAGTTARLVLFIAMIPAGSGPATIGGFDEVKLLVKVPPTVTEAFGNTAIPQGGSTSLTFTITNPTSSETTVTGVGFSDTLPAGLQVATPNGLTGSCGGGTITATAGTSSISLSGGSLAAGDSCTFSVNVTGQTAGTKTNNVTVTTTNEGNSTLVQAALKVISPPSLSEAFGSSSISQNSTTTLTYTVTNTSSLSSLTGVGFTDTLPSGLVVATPNGLVGSCGGGTITATAGSGTVTLSGANLVASGSCSFHIDVLATGSGQMSNTVSVSSNEGGTSSSPTSVVLTVSPGTPVPVLNPWGMGLLVVLMGITTYVALRRRYT